MWSCRRTHALASSGFASGVIDRRLRRRTSGRFGARLRGLRTPSVRGFWQLLTYSGLRKNDVATMRWEDVHEDRIHIPHPKMGKPFDVPLTRQFRDVLVDLREHGAVMYPRSPYV